MPDANGFSRLPFGLWRRQGEGLQRAGVRSAAAGQRDARAAAPSKPKRRPRFACTWATCRRPNSAPGSAISITRGPWKRRPATCGFLHALNQQLRVPMAECKEVAEDLLDAELVCPLGGKFELVEDIGGTTGWQSTAWAGRSLAGPPDDFQAPLLKWFRGIDAHLIKDGDRLTARAELDVQREAPQAGADSSCRCSTSSAAARRPSNPKSRCRPLRSCRPRRCRRSASRRRRTCRHHRAAAAEAGSGEVIAKGHEA